MTEHWAEGCGGQVAFDSDDGKERTFGLWSAQQSLRLEADVDGAAGGGGGGAAKTLMNRHLAQRALLAGAVVQPVGSKGTLATTGSRDVVTRASDAEASFSSGEDDDDSLEEFQNSSSGEESVGDNAELTAAVARRSGDVLKLRLKVMRDGKVESSLSAIRGRTTGQAEKRLAPTSRSDVRSSTTQVSRVSSVARQPLVATSASVASSVSPASLGATPIRRSTQSGLRTERLNEVLVAPSPQRRRVTAVAVAASEVAAAPSVVTSVRGAVVVNDTTAPVLFGSPVVATRVVVPARAPARGFSTSAVGCGSAPLLGKRQAEQAREDAMLVDYEQLSTNGDGHVSELMHKYGVESFDRWLRKLKRARLRKEARVHAELGLDDVDGLLSQMPEAAVPSTEWMPPVTFGGEAAYVVHVSCDGDEADIEVCSSESLASLYDKVARHFGGEFYLTRSQMPTVLHETAASLGAACIRAGGHLVARRRARGAGRDGITGGPSGVYDGSDDDTDDGDALDSLSCSQQEALAIGLSVERVEATAASLLWYPSKSSSGGGDGGSDCGGVDALSSSQ